MNTSIAHLPFQPTEQNISTTLDTLLKKEENPFEQQPNLDIAFPHVYYIPPQLTFSYEKQIKEQKPPRMTTYKMGIPAFGVHFIQSGKDFLNEDLIRYFGVAGEEIKDHEYGHNFHQDEIIDRMHHPKTLTTTLYEMQYRFGA